MLATWYRPDKNRCCQPVDGAGGLASPQELIERYGRNRSRPVADRLVRRPGISFRLGIILEGSHARFSHSAQAKWNVLHRDRAGCLTGTRRSEGER